MIAEVGTAPLLEQADRLALQVVVAQDLSGHFVGDAGQERAPPGAAGRGALPWTCQHDLEVHLDVGSIDAGGVVDKIGIDAPAVLGVFDAAALRETEIAALTHDAGAQLTAVQPHRVVGTIADLAVAFLAGLDVSADAAVPEQVDRQSQYGAHHLDRSDTLLLQLQQGARLRRQCDADLRAFKNEAAGGQQPLIVIGPARARQREQARTFAEAAAGVRIRIDKYVPVIEGCDEADMRREQHAVAEHVSGHVADAGRGEGLAHDVDAELAEVALDAFPGAPRGDAHFLVIVAGRAARGEGVAEPEAVLRGDGVGHIRETRGALVRGDHEIGVVAVAAPHLRRRHDLALDDVVGEVEQSADE